VEGACQQGPPADQHQVAANIERGSFVREANRVVEGGAVGHQGGGRQDAPLMSFHDALVHIGREAEVIGVDYQLFSGSQNIFSWIVRSFLGLA